MPVTKQVGKYSVKATQKAIDSTTLSVSLKQAKALKKAKVSKVKVTATLFYGKKALVVKMHNEDAQVLVENDSSFEHSYLAELNDGTGTIVIFNDKTDNTTTYSYDKNSKQYSKVS